MQSKKKETEVFVDWIFYDKEVLLSKNYITKNGNVYSGNDEILKEFKKKYKEQKEKK